MLKRFSAAKNLVQSKITPTVSLKIALEIWQSFANLKKVSAGEIWSCDETNKLQVK